MKAKLPNEEKSALEIWKKALDNVTPQVEVKSRRVFDPDEWQKIVDFFTRTGRETTPNNRKQAMVPVPGHKVVNHHGTAPGAWFEQDGHCAVLMPGVPHEMKAMWEESVRPLLLARQSCALHSPVSYTHLNNCRFCRTMLY